MTARPATGGLRLPTAAALRVLAPGARARDAAAAGVALALVCGALWFVGYRMLLGGMLGVPGLVATTVADLVSWTAACAGGVAVGWLLPVSRRPTLLHAAAVAGFGLVVGLLRTGVRFYLEPAVGIPPTPAGKLLALSIPLGLLTGSTFAGLGVGLRAVVRRREQDAAAARLEAELAQARMRVLHARLHPRFLAAALDAISRRIDGDAAGADRLLIRLGELLRLSLQRTRAEQVPLSAELEYVAAFLDVEAGRAGTAPVRFLAGVPPELLAAEVPPGSVSTFVEAALGAPERHDRPGTVALRAEAAGGRLRLRISDDAPACAAERARRAGCEAARALVRSLEERFGAAHALRFSETPDGCWAGVLELPLRMDGGEGDAR